MLGLIILFVFQVFAFDNTVERTPLVISPIKKQVLVRTIYDASEMTYQNCTFDPDIIKTSAEIQKFLSQTEPNCSTLTLSTDIETPSDILNFEHELVVHLKKALRLYSIGWSLRDIGIYGGSAGLVGSIARDLSIIMSEKGTVSPFLTLAVRTPLLTYGTYRLLLDNRDFLRASRQLKKIEIGLNQGQWPLVESDFLQQIFVNVAQRLMIEKQGILKSH